MRDSRFIRAFKLPNGRWSVFYGWSLTEKGAHYKDLSYPCVWIVDGIIESITPLNREVAERVPTLVPSLIEVLEDKGTPLQKDHARWVRKIAREAEKRGYAWKYYSYKRKLRKKRLRRYPDFMAWMGKGVFATAAVRTQHDYLGALHEIAHLVSGEEISNDRLLHIEAEMWYWALAHASEKITEKTLAGMLADYRSYLRLYRYLNIHRNAPRPVPMVARSFVAEFRGYETRRYKHRITDLVDVRQHTPYG
jgi:hypothetical protein